MSTQKDSKPVGTIPWTEILKGDHDNNKLYWEQSYKVVVNCVNVTNKLPTIDASDAGLQTLSRQVLDKLNNFFENQKPVVKMSTNDELNMDKLKDWNDKTMDEIKIKTENIKNHPCATTTSSQVVANKNMILTTTAQIHATTQKSAHVKHKLTFENSVELWKPKIKVKPNALRPLELSVMDSNYNEPISYENPYSFEIESFNPDCFAQSEPESMLPESLEDTPLTYIDTESQFEALLLHLQDVTILAVDLEHHSLHSYMGITCLMQITTKTGGDFIIDVLELRDHINKLNVVFTNPAILKVFHGADNDVKWLQRDFGVYLVGLFDTHQAAILLQFPVRTLQYLVRFYCNVELNKEYQKADWRKRPLPAEMIKYARMDTHYLLYIYQMMKEDLLNTGANNLLETAFRKSQDIAKLHYKPDIATNDRVHFDRLMSAKRFNFFQKSLVEELLMWRDRVARENDESTEYVLPNHQILALAASNPKSFKDIIPYCQPMPHFVTEHSSVIDTLIKKCCQQFHPLAARMSGTTLPNETVTSGDYYKTQLYRPHDMKNIASGSLPNPKPVKGSTVVQCDDIYHPNKKNPLNFNFDENDTDKGFSGFISPFDRFCKYSAKTQITGNLRIISVEPIWEPIHYKKTENTTTSDFNKASSSGVFEASTSGTPKESTSVISNVSAASLIKAYPSGKYGPNTSGISKQSTSDIYEPSTYGIQSDMTSRVIKQITSDFYEASSSNDTFDGNNSDTCEASTRDFYEPSSFGIENENQSTYNIYETVTSRTQEYALQQSTSDFYGASTSGIHKYALQQSTSDIYEASTSGIQEYALQESTSNMYEAGTSGIQKYAHQQSTSSIYEASTSGIPKRALKQSTSDIYDASTSGSLKRACKQSISIYEASTSGIPRRALKQSTSDIYDAGTSGIPKHASKQSTSDIYEDKACSGSAKRKNRSSVSKKGYK